MIHNPSSAGRRGIKEKMRFSALNPAFNLLSKYADIADFKTLIDDLGFPT